MPAAYFISPFCPPIWDGETKIRIDPVEYKEALQANWNANIISRDLSSSEYILSWDIIRNDEIIIQGWLQPGNKIVSIQGTAEDMAAFAIWHRNTVSRQESLYLFDEGLHIK